MLENNMILNNGFYNGWEHDDNKAPKFSLQQKTWIQEQINKWYSKEVKPFEKSSNMYVAAMCLRQALTDGGYNES
jgi:hypothetical protein